MAKSLTFDNGLLQLIFNGTTLTGIADNTATSPLTNLYVALHTADPTASGTQNISEVVYTGYARVAVPRTTSGWTVTGSSVSPTGNITFPAGTGGTATATFFSVGVAASGTTQALYSGAINPSIVCGNGVTPILTTASVITES